MSRRYALTVGTEDAGERVDAFLARQAHISRSLAAALARDGRVHVDGQPAKPARHLAAGERLSAEIVLPPALSAAPESIPLNVVYQDRDMAVIDKPAGLVVHPAPGHRSGTLANALTARFPHASGVGSEERPGIVHRLDKDTSGLLVVALNQRAQAALQRQIASREAERHYLALITGHVKQESATIEAPVGRDVRDRRRMAPYGAAARPARTSYDVRERLPGFDLLEAKLHTGRTHQIRVHLAGIGHPVAGDTLYGGASVEGLGRQFLHAYRLTVRSPSTGEIVDIESPLPHDLRAVLGRLRE